MSRPPPSATARRPAGASVGGTRQVKHNAHGVSSGRGAGHAARPSPWQPAARTCDAPQEAAACPSRLVSFLGQGLGVKPAVTVAATTLVSRACVGARLAVNPELHEAAHAGKDELQQVPRPRDGGRALCNNQGRKLVRTPNARGQRQRTRHRTSVDHVGKGIERPSHRRRVCRMRPQDRTCALQHASFKRGRVVCGWHQQGATRVVSGGATSMRAAACAP